ncbi:DUF2309 domain-containing protein [Accumulibacter sp.]|uniref:DUF2309 domain-containing protein n=1 Tax=Accumulibacter sp. TaxID=2053492 RepID=UPI0025ED122D|nr:DUF2309 domain-containing protein [Accumulibacter sp.]MCM8627265.1 DUF2309 domain-containing protein [Accumulibacter sp.]
MKTSSPADQGREPGGNQTRRVDSLAELRTSIAHLAHLLPAQAPLRDFVHHNTLHAFQHLPFAEALAQAARLSGARPWPDEARCRELLASGRIGRDDLIAGLRQLPATRPDEPVYPAAGARVRRGEVLQVALLHSPLGTSATRLRWQIEENSALARWAPDLDVAARERLREAARRDGLAEGEAVADLWDVTLAFGSRPSTATHGFAAELSAAAASVLWQRLLDRLGDDWTLRDLLEHLTGEDIGLALQPALIRHLAAHLDLGLAGWRNPARQNGFYAAWRDSSSQDWGWDLDEFPAARRELAELADDPLLVIAGELERLGIAQAGWPGYLQRLALELPGWAGMCHRRETHPQAGQAPVCLSDFLAVRLVLERLHVERLVNRVWGVALPALGAYFADHPAELLMRHAFGAGELPDDLLDCVRPHLVGDAGEGGCWLDVATTLGEADVDELAAAERAMLAAWPLFRLAQYLGIGGRELRELGPNGAQALLDCVASLDAAGRGQVWLLASEHHYRQQILGALAANHGRARATVGQSVAQVVLCMDDREEGTRRHLEEVNPAIETYGAAGFFGVPMLWQGLDDEAPTALCPVVVRPTNVLREQPPPAAEAAWQAHRRRRYWRLAWHERLVQESRRGLLRAALLCVVAGPAALLALFARTIAPARLGVVAGRLRAAFDKDLGGIVEVTAEAGEALRPASAEQPRAGFAEDEQVARVAGFLRSIGLTSGFAPFVLIVGHGSDSRNNPHLAAYDCGACSGRHGGPNARAFAAMANRPTVRAALASEGIVIPRTTHFLGAEHNTCDESFVWYDEDCLPASHRQAFAALRRDCREAARRHAVERCRRFASAPRHPSPHRALAHLAGRRHDIAQARPELGHATIAAALVGRRTMSRGLFLDRRVFLISYDPLSDPDGRILEATLLAAGPVGAGISLEYYFSSVDNERFGCGTKITHNLTGLFGVMNGVCSDLRTGLPRQMIEIHEPIRLLVVAEQTTAVLGAIYRRQPPLQELIGNGWIVLAAQDPQSGAIELFDPLSGWQPWAVADPEAGGWPGRPTEVECSAEWFAGHADALPPALLRRPVARR